MNEWDDLNEISSFVTLRTRAHFSYLIENLMDMYHGSLHAQYQVWTAESLKEVVEGENQVSATYQATTYYRGKRSRLHSPAVHPVTPKASFGSSNRHL